MPPSKKIMTISIKPHQEDHLDMNPGYHECELLYLAMYVSILSILQAQVVLKVNNAIH